MARSTRYSCLARPNLLLTEYRFHIHYMEKRIRKLRKNFDRDPTVGLKVIAPSTLYSCLSRPDLLFTEYRFQIYYMEKSLQKLM